MADYTQEERLEAVKRKLNVTWQNPETDGRLDDVIAIASPTLASRIGYEHTHAFSPADGEPWGLFLNACLYEFSDALDDFWRNYAEELRTARLLITKGEHVAGDDSEP